MSKVVLVTGGFDPLHSGHIKYLNHADHLGDFLVVGLNSDDWLARKKGRAFMPWKERMIILDNLHMTDDVIAFDDSDGTAVDAIRIVKEKYPEATSIVFANGGDRTAENIPEMVFDDVEFVFSVGGDDKANSSSWILKEWSQPTVERAWGKYIILDHGDGWQAKQLAFDSGKALSDQRHFKRSEHWHIVEGLIEMRLEYANGDIVHKKYGKGESIDIPKFTWHKATNVGIETARVVEVWLGDELTEEDIERRD